MLLLARMLMFLTPPCAKLSCFITELCINITWSLLNDHEKQITEMGNCVGFEGEPNTN